MRRKGEVLSAEEIAAIEQPIYEEYAAQSDAYFATSEVWDDGIIDPTDTRNTLGMAISASLNAPFAHPAQGILRV